jgi:hypothetical protein
MKHHRPGGGVIGVGVGLDDHGGQPSALVVVTGQRFWVSGLCACSRAGKVGQSQRAVCGAARGHGALAPRLGCAPRGAEPGDGHDRLVVHSAPTAGAGTGHLAKTLGDGPGSDTLPARVAPGIGGDCRSLWKDIFAPLWMRICVVLWIDIFASRWMRIIRPD